MNTSADIEISPASLSEQDGLRSPHPMTVAGDMATQALIEDLENQYVSLKSDRDRLQTEVEDERRKTGELTQNVSHQHDLELQLQQYKNDFALTSSKLETINENRKWEREQMDRKSAESDSLREEVRYVKYGHLSTHNSPLSFP
jgi:regulator of PEP synthase PpsR (kinase-PPPase family)